MGRRRGHVARVLKVKFNLVKSLFSHAHHKHPSSSPITPSSSSSTMSSLTPLRDRPQATDPWQPTTPLRISKRAESPVTQQPPPTARPPLDRRTSGSYTALKDRKVVSKSPFLARLASAIPAPSKASPGASPRKVSTGEKRQRTLSMNNQAENEHPLGFKRRQSRGFQGLLQKEPVSKSPFRKPAPVENIPPPPALPSPASSLPTPIASDEEDEDDDDLPPPPPAKELFADANGRYSPSPHRTSPSPARSSLVSKRLHGPRTPSRGSDSDKGERRKTVTFDETCDVMEYDVEDEDSGALADGAEPFSWVRDHEDEDEGEEDSFELRANFNMQLNRSVSTEDVNIFDDQREHVDREDDAPTQDNDQNHDERSDGDLDDEHDDDLDDDADTQPRGRAPAVRNKPSLDLSIEGLHIGADDSITGLVDSLLQDARPRTPPPAQPTLGTQRAPVPLPVDVETEDGIPLGRTHHVERAREAHRVHHALFHEEGGDKDGDAQDEEDAPSLPLAIATASISSIPSTPPRYGSLDSATPGLQIPLGRSTHSERRQARRQAEIELEKEVDEDVGMLPPSPSPAKAKREAWEREQDNLVFEGFIPKFELATVSGGYTSTMTGADPFFLAEPVAKPFAMHSNLSRDSLFADLRSSTPINHDGMPPPSLGIRNGSPSGSRGTSPLPPGSRGASPLPANSRGASPLPPPRSGSSSPAPSRGSSPLPSSGSPSGSPRSPRISREEVRRRLAKKRSGSYDSIRNSYLAEEAKELSKEKDNVDVTPTSRRAATDVGQSRASLDSGTSSATGPNKIPRVPPPPLSRLNPSYDGVMAIDPAPQPIDPPRPSLATRASSLQEMTETGTSSPFTDAHLINAYDVTVVEAGSTGAMGSSPDTGSTLVEGTVSKNKGVQLGDMKSALDRLMADVAGEARMGSDSPNVVGLKVEAVTEGVTARRFGAPADDSDDGHGHDELTIRDDDNMDVDPVPKPEIRVDIPPPPPKDVSTLLHANFLSPTLTTPSSIPIRTPSTRDAIRRREELIKAKKREARRREAQEEDDSDGSGDEHVPIRTDLGRPSRRRSKSTGDAETMMNRKSGAERRRDNLSGGTLLDLVAIEDEEDPLRDSIDRELERLRGPGKKYHIRQRSETIYASADAESSSSADGEGNGESSKAWRPLKRPSDMNEYAKQIKELQAQENSGKGYAKVFVKVVGIRNLNVPIPQQPTAATCTLNNGIHFVTTPECRLGTESRIDQEFELIEHSKLEFTLAIKIRRDPHIVAQFKANTPPPPPPPPRVAPPPPSKGGVRSFFLGSTPKRSSKVSPTPPPQPPPAFRLPENLARYLKPDGTLGRAFIAFKDIAKRCDTRLFETCYPLIGQKSEANGPPKTVQIGEIVLQIFRLPPLSGIPPDQLPQSLEECHRGLRHVAWHKVTYFEGTLTQSGGDCLSWRRRHLRVVGANLVAFNDVTKKAIATIDLKKAIAVQDDQEAREEIMSPASAHSARSSRYFEFDGPYGVERSIRLIFPNNQEIIFFADTDEEKTRWLEVLRALVGRIPPNPLWAELVWQRQHQLSKMAVPASGPSSSSIPTQQPSTQNR